MSIVPGTLGYSDIVVSVVGRNSSFRNHLDLGQSAELGRTNKAGGAVDLLGAGEVA